jgi:hypothetical protein
MNSKYKYDKGNFMTVFEWISGVWMIISFIIIGVLLAGCKYKQGKIIRKSKRQLIDETEMEFFFQVLITEDETNQSVLKIKVSEKVYNSYQEEEKFSVEY